MIVVSDYRSFRIEVEAIKAEGAAAEGHYNADVRMRRLFSQEKPRAERATRFKLTPDLAERAGELWAKRAIDQTLTR